MKDRRKENTINIALFISSETISILFLLNNLKKFYLKWQKVLVLNMYKSIFVEYVIQAMS